MKQLLILTLLFASLSPSAQKVFFRSDQAFTEKQLESFYSAISVNDSMVVFNANDYKIYAYDKTTGSQKWVYNLGRKTTTLQFLAGNYIWTNANDDEGLRLDLSGRNAKKLPFSIYSKPVIKNNTVYTTGIYDAGNLIAYDMAADSVKWYQFIAHGCDTEPVYLDDRIIANAEGTNWVRINYDGSLEKECQETPGTMTNFSGCAREYNLLTHDGKEVKGKLAGQLGIGEGTVPEVIRTAKKTYVLDDGRLSIIGNNLKKIYSKEVFTLADGLEEDDWKYSALLKANDESVWICYNEKLIIFDPVKKKLLRLVDLSSWEPHRVVADGQRLWIVSKKDGLLYGISIEES